MKRQNLVLFLVIVAAAVLVRPRAAAAGGARAGEPTDQIRTAVADGVEFLNKARLDNQARAETIAKLKKVVNPLFDFDEMARRSLGAHWRRLDANQQREFVAVFTDLLEKTYATNIDLYDGQKVTYIGETIDQDYAEVRTKLLGKKGESYSVDYKLLHTGGKW